LCIIKPIYPRAGASLIELLCVLGILSLLGAIYGTPVFQTFMRIKAFIETLQ